MKKLLAFLNTPARVLIAVGAVILVGEFLIMLLIENIQHTPLKDVFLERESFEFLDPLLLIFLVSPALFLLIFKPMRAQQVELERQVDELGRFQRVGIGRELRMKELVEENTALRNPFAVEPAGDIPVTSGSLEALRHAVERHVTTQPTEQSQRSALLFMLEDLDATHRKVEQAHQEWMAALDVVDDPIFLHDKNFRILRCNKAYQQRAGIPFHELIGQPYYEVFPKTAAPPLCGLRVMEKAEEEVAVGDAIYRSRAFPVMDEQGVYLCSVHALEDITENRRAEAALHDSEEKFRIIFDGALDGILLADAQTRQFLMGNPAICLMLGYSPEEIIRLSVADIHPQQAFSYVVEQFEKQLRGEIQLATDIPVKRKDGSVFYADIKSSPVNFGGKNYLVGIFRDVTERKLTESVLRDSEEQYRTMIENSNDMIWTLAPDGRFTFINQQAADITVRSIEDWLGKTFEPLVVEEDLPMVLEMHGKIMRGEKVHYEVRGKKADGGILTLSVNASPIYKDDKVSGTISFASDITGRRQAEVASQHANRALATLSAVNRQLVHAENEDELLQAICQAIVEQHGYRLAWVGYVQHDESKSIKIMAHAGHDEGYLDAMQLTWAETERGMGLSGRAVRSGATQLCQDIANDPQYLPWRDAALQRGFTASIALPLLNEGNMVFGILHVYAGEVNAFTPTEVDLLEEMAGDLAFGVHTLHTHHERDLVLELNRRQLVQLQDSLEDTVRAIASIVEMRDPYTAGHQTRVADLAAAIARQMELPDEQVHGIHLAGTVHDLGKIRIPAEILSKPGKITGIEHGLIKVHPQAGYDILQGIDFPWPIAQMVLQHHERLDGSGYPQGLKGEAILLEARILSVADVVEAMSSHRPYRPGLGIEVALTEIIQQRGTYYDPQVVDACLVLFREQYYSFK